MSHRLGKLKVLLNPGPTRCKVCGSTDIMLGKKHGLCKSCRNIIPRPKGGWRDKDGKHIKTRLMRCPKCGKTHGRSNRSELPDACPACGAGDQEVVDRW